MYNWNHGNTNIDSEEMNMSTPLHGVSVPRWQRKQQQQQQQQQLQLPSQLISAQQTPSINNKTFSTTPTNSILKMSDSITCATTPLSPLSSSSSSSSSASSSGPSDRFIPSRTAMNMEHSYFNLTSGAEKNGASSSSSAGSDPGSSGAGPSSSGSGASGNSANENEYENSLAERVLDSPASLVLSFKTKPAPPKQTSSTMNDNLRAIYSQNKTLLQASNRLVPRGPCSTGGPGAAAGSSGRVLPQAPSKMLDAPDLVDDYYLNLLDWSSQNILAVALAQSVYLWNAETGGISELCRVEESDNYITSVSWTQDGAYLGVGTNSAEVRLYDIVASRQVRSMGGHQARVGALAWNEFLLSSGSRDTQIFHHDVRVQNHHVATLSHHQQEVCGLKWSLDGRQLASGGNDNLLLVWDRDQVMAPRHELTQHRAAVKAVAWCPWQSNLLATGGGTNDRTLRFWNTSTGACLNVLETQSQVCSIVWSRHERELVTSHGFSQNQLTLWKYPSLVKMGEFTGHTSRVLHMALSPDGSTVVSAAGDETLRFWSLFPTPEQREKKIQVMKNSSNGALNSGIRIR